MNTTRVQWRPDGEALRCAICWSPLVSASVAVTGAGGRELRLCPLCAVSSFGELIAREHGTEVVGRLGKEREG